MYSRAAVNEDWEKIFAFRKVRSKKGSYWGDACTLMFDDGVLLQVLLYLVHRSVLFNQSRLLTFRSASSWLKEMFL